MRQFFILLIIIKIFLVIPLVSSAHFIVGEVVDAYDGQVADGSTIMLWNQIVGESDNLTDKVGILGQSKNSGTYMIDCEALQSPCEVNDILSLRIINNGTGYVSITVNINVTGAGFDIAPLIRLNSPPFVTSLIVDDITNSPVGEIDLNAANTKDVYCYGSITDYDGENDISNTTAIFFDTVTSTVGGIDDNNNHYSNTSCSLNTAFGDGNQTAYNCTLSTWYYALPNLWNCTIIPRDLLNTQINRTNTTFINPLLAIEVPFSINYGIVDGENVSGENIINITNFGNVFLNISLSGYGATQGDNLAMNCSGKIGSQNISITNQKYNLTTSNPDPITIIDFNTLYQNLTNNSIIRLFNLAYKQDDIGINITNSTYWRIYVPPSTAGNCTGNIILGARVAPGI